MKGMINRDLIKWKEDKILCDKVDNNVNNNYYDDLNKDSSRVFILVCGYF